jgi:hypothetical protein
VTANYFNDRWYSMAFKRSEVKIDSKKKYKEILWGSDHCMSNSVVTRSIQEKQECIES